MDVKFHVLLSCLFRWPDMIGEDYELKRLATCTTCIENDLDEITGITPAPSDLHLVCINPHHYGRINLQESVPSPYVIYQLNDLPCDSTEADSSNPSISFDSAGKSFDDHSSYSSICKASFDSSWCAIAYWEFRERVGRIFDVKSSTVNIFQQLPEGEGFWLGALNRDGVSGNISNTDSNQCDSRVFHRIGYGLQLSREDDSVWIYNRSEHPLYVNSPLYNKNIQSTHNTEVKKVQPGYSLKVFNYARVDMPQQIRPYVGPRYPYSIRISFVKGWGRNYTRQFITSCPCWLEILLNVSH
ncbi:uncharacterized protein TRIADDRAFT_52368 [Trichoplax adhaerens]|uniref:Mothers against decapentaplegic homolog n=1 Tax=Trichoplax adhaerens TaxID=10228 RepID=B3RI36_TRIAD|nr:hypothetical protein TRIADDRAFT_52368 [Trichoplax adhaerens]EDV28965.1 hypothetical protein TRIADDRAFT_52368 [Trichoplax adhaerens]|eukprot:XP_002108167.1 hypothetical protein TRIADDRAFT_52368 [Trichoplax adhaerens]